MRKQYVAVLLALLMVMSAFPVTQGMAAQQMRDGVPVWTEETVKEYAYSYIKGDDLETLRGYYDLQVRRYMPMETYEVMLTDMEWITGEFIEFGTYHFFVEKDLKLKTHVLHLCMEKQDLDLYFTHKDKEDDWEVMAVEFAYAEKQAVSDRRDMLVTDEEEAKATYSEEEVTIGTTPYELKGILTIPYGASRSAKVPACILVHGSGPQDMDETVGETKLFADIAKAFAEKGIATLRYEKRTYAYGASMSKEEIDAITVEEETIQDAIAAAKLLQAHDDVDASRIVLVGHSLGAMLAPRIATEAGELFAGVLMIAGTPKTLLEIMILQNEDAIAKMDEQQQLTYEEQLASIALEVKKLDTMTAEEAKGTTLFGIKAYYFWEMQQYDQIEMLKALKVPVYIVQGNEDFQVTMENGIEAYEDLLGDTHENIDYKTYRGLNHLLMKYTGVSVGKGTIQEYDTPATLDASAANDLAAWVNRIGKEIQDEDE